VLSRPKETLFFVNNNKGRKIVHSIRKRSFDVNDKNMYRIIDAPCLNQEYDGSCGYYAIFNLKNFVENEKLMSKRTCDFSFMCQRGKFEQLFSRDRVRSVCSNFFESTGLYGLDERGIGGIISKEVSQLYRDDVIIAFFDLFSKSELRAEILNYYVLTRNRETIEKKIKDFRAGKTVYLIVGSPFNWVNKNIDVLSLEWDNSGGRRVFSPGHWVTMRIAWDGIPMKSPVVIHIADSDGRENRFTALVHWYYYLFVHRDLQK